MKITPAPECGMRLWEAFRKLARHGWLALAGSILAFQVFLVVIIQVRAVQEYGWQGLRAGDLRQHLAAAHYLRSHGQWEKVYQGFGLGDYLKEMFDRLEPDHTLDPRNFNYVYPPHVLAISSWAVDWPPWVWVLIFYAGFVVTLFLSWFWLARAFPGSFLSQPVGGLFFLGCPAVFYSLLLKQNPTLVLCIMSGAVLLLARGFPFWAGWVFSCVVFKPQIALFVGGCAFLIGRWRFLFGLGSGCALWLLGSILWLGWEPHAWWIASLRDMASGAQGQKWPWATTWRALGLTHGSWELGSWPDLAMVALGGAVGLAAMGLFWRRFPGRQRNLWFLPVALATLPAAAPYCLFYDLLLAAPFWLLSFNWLKGSAKALSGVTFWLVCFLSALGMHWGFSFAAPFISLWLLGVLWFRDNPLGQASDPAA